MSHLVALEALLGQPLFGWDTLTLLGDIEDFIDFSEASIARQFKRQLWRIQEEHAAVIIDDPRLDAQYKDQQLEGLNYRFTVSLAQRVRYSALTALITSVEWSLLALRQRALFAVPDRPKKATEVTHLLSVFAAKVNQDLTAERELLALLVQVRNCIVHSAGLVETYKHAADLRTQLSGYQGIKVSRANFLGDGIEIEPKFLQRVVQQAKQWLPALEKALYEQGQLKQ